MKFGDLKSVGHNIADSLASGIGLMVGIYELEIFAEALAAPEGYIDVDFLTGKTSGGKVSPKLQSAVTLYAEALPDLCERHDVDVSDFQQLTARYSGREPHFERYDVTIVDKSGRRSTDEYLGLPGKRLRGLRRTNHI